MAHPRLRRSSAPLIAGLAGVGLLAGLAYAGRPRRQSDPERDLGSYLHDHLAGSDAALVVVSRLARSHEGTAEGALFEGLRKEFTSERAVVRSVLAQLGTSAFSAKRAVGQAAGVVLQAVAGGDVGSLALFRTLESLLIGVQGKRCLWRALQGLDLEFRESDDFPTLEGQALDQWQRIEALRQRRLRDTFGFSN